MEDTRKFHVKFALCGNLAVGKTSIRRNFMGLHFTRDHVSTLGADFSLKKMKIGQDQLNLQIWDMGGEDEYQQLRKKFFHGTRGALLVLSLVDRQSYLDLPNWLEELHENAPIDRTPVVFLGNKCDLDNSQYEVNRAEIKSFIEEYVSNHNLENLNYKYFETSAKDGINIDEAFYHLAEITLKFLDQDISSN